MASAEEAGEGAANGAVQTLQIRDDVYLIAGAGQNIVMQTGTDGTYLINAGRAGASDAVLAAIKRITDQPVRYIYDTSAEADAVGGNGALAQAGRSVYYTGPEVISSTRFLGNSLKTATILAPSAVLFRVSAPTGQVAPFPTEDWPSQAFETDRYYIYANHEPLEFYRVAAHDNTDSLVQLRREDVIVAGNVIDADRFPKIDVSHGGSIQGEIDALNQIIDMSDVPMPFIWEPGGSYIVPAYGHLYQQIDVVQYRDMMVEARDIVQDMIKRKMTLGQIQSADPLVAYEGQYGRDSGAWTTKDFVQAVYQSLMQQAKPKSARTARDE